jgi:hypothetical protein
MRICVESAMAANELAEYLQRCGCIVERTGAKALEVSPVPRSLAAEHAELELSAYVRVWRALNPEVEVEIVSADARVGS